MEKYLQRNSIESFEINNYQATVIENPQKALSDSQKERIVQDASLVLEQTTGLKDRDASEIERYLFGVENRGRVLYLFYKEEELVGFTSCHLLNDGEELLRFNDRTVAHGGSSHILPSEQGNRLWLSAAVHYINSLETELRPGYVSAFTQSPRLLRLMTHVSKGNIYPNQSNANTPQTQELRALQDYILPTLLLSKGDKKVENGCVVKEMSDRVYSEKLYTGNEEFDEFFYKTLGVDTDNGDYVHFVVKIPEDIYKK